MKNNIKINLVKLLSVAFIVLVIFGLSKLLQEFQGTSKNKSLYSENQTRIIDNFGEPQVFTLAKEDGNTLEYWKYIFLDEIFVFENGEFVSREHFNFDTEEDEAIYLGLSPKDFYAITSIEEINKLLESEPNTESELDSGLLGKGYKFYSYDDLLNITTKDDLVQGIQGVAYKKTGDKKKVTTEEALPGQKPGKDFVGNSNDEDNSFSFYLDAPAFRMIKQRVLWSEDDGDDYPPTFGYCYTLDEGKSFSTQPENEFACADEESLLWTIEMVTPKEYKKMDEVDLVGMEKLAESEDYVFLISHSNGDLPEELPDWTKTLASIEDTFASPMGKEYAETLKKS